MELADGYRKTGSRSAHTSLLPPRDIVQSLMSPESSRWANEDEMSTYDSLALSLDSTGMAVLDKYMDRLQRIFQVYCSFGEPMNATQMKSQKLQKLLTDCGLLAPPSRKSRK